MQIVLEHPNLRKAETVKFGFSWTTLFFGFLVPLSRGDLTWSLLMAVIAVASGGISWIVFPFIYNNIYIKKMVKQGYKPLSDLHRMLLFKKGLMPVGVSIYREDE